MKTGRDKNRELVRIRDNYTCQDCGAIRTPEQAKQTRKRLFDIHHLDGMCGKKSRGYDKLGELDGLITLCHRCHYHRDDFNGKHTNIKYAIRNEKIKERYLNRECVADMVQEYSISHQRIYQILEKLSTPIFPKLLL